MNKIYSILNEFKNTSCAYRIIIDSNDIFALGLFGFVKGFI